MIIGSGLIASELSGVHLPKGWVVYARGVSDSKSCISEEFERDRRSLVNSISPDLKVIYISSQACGDPSESSSYIVHKRELEKTVLETSRDNVVLRLPQVCGPGGNPNNLVNFMSAAASEGGVLLVDPGARRNLVRGSDLRGLVSSISQIEVSGLVGFCAPYTYSAGEVALAILSMVGDKDATFTEVTESRKSDFSFFCSEIFSAQSDQIRNFGRQNYLYSALQESLR